MDRLQIGGRSLIFNSVFILLNILSLVGVYFACSYEQNMLQNGREATVSWDWIFLSSSILFFTFSTYLIILFRGGLLLSKALRIIAGFWLLFRAFSFLNDLQGLEIELDIRLMDGQLTHWFQGYIGTWFSFSELSPVVAAYTVTIIELSLGVFLLIGYKMRFTAIIFLLFTLGLLFFRIQEFQEPLKSFFLPVRREPLSLIIDAWFSLWIAISLLISAIWILIKSWKIEQNTAQDNVVVLIIGFVSFLCVAFFLNWYSLLIFFPLFFLGTLWITRITTRNILNVLGTTSYLCIAGLLIVLYGFGFGTIKDFGRFNEGDKVNMYNQAKNEKIPELKVFLPLREASQIEYKNPMLSRLVQIQSRIKILQHRSDSSLLVIPESKYNIAHYPDSVFDVTYSGLDSVGMVFPGDELMKMNKLAFLLVDDRVCTPESLDRWHKFQKQFKKIGGRLFIIHPVSITGWNIQIVGEERGKYKIPSLFADRAICKEISRYDQTLVVMDKGKIIRKYEGYFQPSNEKIIEELKLLWQTK